MNVKDLDEKSQKKLLDVTSREEKDLTIGDKLFLQARRDYLSEEQKRTYRGSLAEHVSSVTVEKAVPSYRSLQKKALDLGAQTVVGVSREELEDFIRTTEGPANAEKPE